MSALNKVSQLESLGYNQFFEDNRLKLGVNIDCLARVIAEHKGAYAITDLDGERRSINRENNTCISIHVPLYSGVAQR